MRSRKTQAIRNQATLSNDVGRAQQGNRLSVQPSSRSRASWGEKFHSMADARDDVLPDGLIPTRFDTDEWTW
jgi:hypothetical protein